MITYQTESCHIKWIWQELDPEIGGYAAAELTTEDDFQVFTTSISTDPSEKHFKKLTQKIESYQEQQRTKSQLLKSI